MSWHDDFDADEYDEHRPAPVKARATRRQMVGRVAGYTGLVAGVAVLAVGTVLAVSALGIAAKPGGFGAPAARPDGVALPPVITPFDDGEQPEPTDGPTEPTGEPAEVSGSAIAPMPQIDPAWAADIAKATGIPARAVAAYALAHVSIAEEQPQCGLTWTTLAAIGAIESKHGSHGNTVLDENGRADPPIIGPALDGNGVAKIADTDDGVLDGDDTWDRAVGPMQFIPSTWAKWGSDANGDDVADPNQIDDAALATARYLCASGSMTSAEGWRAAVFSYNHDNDYVDKVAKVANEFAESAG